jgi:hypothetical protein
MHWKAFNLGNASLKGLKMNLNRLAAPSLGLIAILSTAPVSAQEINGNYDGYACQNDFRSQLALDIAWPVMTYFESSCTVTSSAPGVTNGYIVSCSGEGDEWTGQVVITRTANGGLILNQNGADVTYNRC